MPTTQIDAYFANLQRLLDTIRKTQAAAMQQAAGCLAKALAAEKRIFAFGTGHSHMLALELFYRAGGLVRIYPVLESALMLHESASKSSALERLEGYGTALFSHHQPQAGDVLLVFSNSGRNAATVEFARLCREHGVAVVALTSLQHAATGASRHTSGKKLHEFADVVLDNCGCVGDASLTVPGLKTPVAPTSTAAGAAILNAIVAQAVANLTEQGFTPEVFYSSNVDGGDAINQTYLQRYKGEIPSL